MVLRSNVVELIQIKQFCLQKSLDHFRFDPFLHLRFDGNKKRNKEIAAERLSAEEIVVIEQQDSERKEALNKNCSNLINPDFEHTSCNHLFHCGAGNGNFTVSYDGFFRLCSSLWHPKCIFNLKEFSLSYIWQNFILKVRDMRSNNKEFLEKCRKCEIINLCMWCPAHSYLENNELDEPVKYFCDIAHARAKSLKAERGISK